MIDKLISLSETLRAVLEPLEALAKGYRRDAIKGYVLRDVVNKIESTIENADAIRYGYASVATLQDDFRKLTADRDYWRDLGNRYLAEAIKNLPDPAGFPDVVESLRGGNWIMAIKHYKTHTGCGLREAKDKIETVRDNYRAA